MQEQQQGSAPADEPTPDSARVVQQESPCEVVITRIARAATGQLAQELRESPREVVITRLDIPFMNLLVFFIKAGLASIPAAIIVGIIYMTIIMIFGGGFMGGMGGRHW